MTPRYQQTLNITFKPQTSYWQVWLIANCILEDQFQQAYWNIGRCWASCLQRQPPNTVLNTRVTIPILPIMSSCNTLIRVSSEAFRPAVVFNNYHSVSLTILPELLAVIEQWLSTMRFTHISSRNTQQATRRQMYMLKGNCIEMQSLITVFECVFGVN